MFQNSQMDNKKKVKTLSARKEKIAKSVIKAFKAKKAKTVPPQPASPESEVSAKEPGQKPKESVVSIDLSSPTEIEKVEEPSIIRLARNVGQYGGAALGGLIGGRFGFGKEGIEFGTTYGKQLGDFASRQLVQHMPILGSFQKGGRVHKTGAYILHKGEKVVPVRKRKRS